MREEDTLRLMYLQTGGIKGSVLEMTIKESIRVRERETVDKYG